MDFCQLALLLLHCFVSLEDAHHAELVHFVRAEVIGEVADISQKLFIYLVFFYCLSNFLQLFLFQSQFLLFLFDLLFSLSISNLQLLFLFKIGLFFAVVGEDLFLLFVELVCGLHLLIHELLLLQCQLCKCLLHVFAFILVLRFNFPLFLLYFQQFSIFGLSLQPHQIRQINTLLQLFALVVDYLIFSRVISEDFLCQIDGILWSTWCGNKQIVSQLSLSLSYTKQGIRKQLKGYLFQIKVQVMSGQITDQQLQTYIDFVFTKYDADREGTLNCNELANFFNDMFAKMGSPTRVNQQQATQALNSIDQNRDGKAQKIELFHAFKKLLAGQNLQGGNQGGYGGNQGWGGNQGNQQQGSWGNQSQGGWGNNQGQNQQQGGWGSQQQQGQQGGWGGNQNQGGWNQNQGGWNQSQGQGNQPNQGWGNNQGNQQQGGWGNQSQGGWGNQQGNQQGGWGNQQQQGGWGNQQGQNQQQGGWGSQQQQGQQGGWGNNQGWGQGNQKSSGW